MNRFKSPFWEALGVIAGMIIGSGMFALPYAVSISGIGWASVMAALAFFAVFSIHLAYGEITWNTKQIHRLPGYAKMYLGSFFGNFSKAAQFLGFNAALLVYGTLGGIFLKTIFGGDSFWWTLIFFVFGSVIFLKGSIARIGFINFILTVPLIAAILFISFLAFRVDGFSNLPFSGEDPFFSFGVFVFSLAGLSVIADAREIFGDRDSSQKASYLKRAISVGTIVPLILYFIFIIAVLSSAGNAVVTPDTLSGLISILGEKIILLGAIIGILAVFTSYLALGYDLKEIYELDIGLGRSGSWILTAILPAIFFISGMENFVKLISITGGVFLAIDGIMVAMILRKMRKLGSSEFKFLPFGGFHQVLLVAVLALSIVYELIYQIF